mgnify:CR=1 FL=1|tara:strand:- start:71 stop:364 length:294 start_codon:yes stop_codon:yes gene_type:complete
MAEAIKFTEDEIQSINELRQEVGETFTQLGQLSIQRIGALQQLEAQETKLTEQHKSLVEKEQEIFKGLNEKYGDGNFDPQSGTFTPTPKEETTELEG